MGDYKSTIKIRREISKKELNKFAEAIKNMGDSFVTLNTSINGIRWNKIKQRLPRKLKKRLSKA